MADYIPLFKQIAGCWQDNGRADVPGGHLWDIIDYLLDHAGAPMRERGGWIFQNSDAFPNVPNGGVYAPFTQGKVLIVVNSNNVRRVAISSVTASTNIGVCPVQAQNPLFWRDRVILPGDGNAAPQLVTQITAGAFGLLLAHATAGKGRFGAIYKDRLVMGGPIGNEQQVAFSKPGDPTIAWDALSVFNTSLPVKGLFPMRNQVIVFHDGSAESIIGTTPPDSSATDPTGDMRIAPLYEKAGCYDARSIVGWRDRCIFADSRGIHITDGSSVDNMVEQAGMLTAWQRDFNLTGQFVSAGVFRNYCLVTLRGIAGGPTTYVINLTTRKITRYSNIDAGFYASFSGTSESLFSSDSFTQKITDLTPIFAPNENLTQQDGNVNGPLATFETGWLKVQPWHRRFVVGEGFRRIIDLFLAYSCVIQGATSNTDVLTVAYLHSPTDTTYEVLGTFKHAVEYMRNKLRIGRRLQGISIKVTAIGLGARKDLRIHAADVTGYPEEQRRVR